MSLHIFGLVLLAIIFYGYVAYVWSQFGVLDSISNSYYKLPDKRKLFFPAFTTAMGVILFLFWYQLNDYWFFAAGALIMVVGIAAQTSLDKLISEVHFLGATGSILCANVGLMHQGVHYPLYITVAAAAIIYARKFSSQIWWMEIVSFSMILLGFVQIQLK